MVRNRTLRQLQRVRGQSMLVVQMFHQFDADAGSAAPLRHVPTIAQTTQLVAHVSIVTRFICIYSYT